MICKKGLAFFCHSDEMNNLSLNNHSLYMWHFSLFENYFPDINIATSTCHQYPQGVFFFFFFCIIPMVEVMKIMVTSFKRSHACTASLSAPDPAAGHHQRLLDTHRQVWVSLLWGHCSFLLGLGAQKLLFVPSKSLFPQSCVSSVV